MIRKCETFPPFRKCLLIVLCTFLLSFDNVSIGQSSEKIIPEKDYKYHYSSSYKFYASDPDLAISHSKKAAEIALQEKNYEKIGRAHYMSGYIKKITGDLPNAFNYFLKAEKAYKLAIEGHPELVSGSVILSLSKYLRDVQEHLGTIAMDNNSMSTAIQMYQNRLSTARQIDDRSIAQAYFDLGLAHYFHNQIDSSYSYHLKAKSLYQNGGFYTQSDADDLARIYIEIGVIHYQLGEDLHNHAQYDSAITKYHQALQLTDSPTTIAMIWNNIGYTQLARKQYQLAKSSIQKAITINEADQQFRNLVDNYNNLGRIYYETNNTDSAIHYFSKSVEVNIGFDDFHQNHRDTQLAIDMNQNYELSTSMHYLDSLSQHNPMAINATSATRIVDRYYEMVKSGRLQVQKESQSIIDQMYQNQLAKEKKMQQIQLIKRWVLITIIGLLSLIVLYLSYHLIRYRSLKNALNQNIKRVLLRSEP